MWRQILAGALACMVLTGPSVVSDAVQPFPNAPRQLAVSDVEISEKRRYRDLTFTQLCRRSRRAFFDRCKRGSVLVNGRPFRYQIKSCCFSKAIPPDSIDAAKSSCRAVRVRYAVSDSDVVEGAYAMGIALVTDEPGSYTERTAEPGTVGRAKIRFGLPEHWYLKSYANPMDRFPVYLRGKVSCYTRSGDR